MATAAVIGGTAAATSHAMDRRMTQKDMAKQQEADAQYAAVQSQSDLEDMKEQMAAMQAQQAQAAMQAQTAPAPPAAGTDLTGKLQQLAQLKEAGALTEEEYAKAKRDILEASS